MYFREKNDRVIMMLNNIKLINSKNFALHHKLEYEIREIEDTLKSVKYYFDLETKAMNTLKWCENRV